MVKNRLVGVSEEANARLDHQTEEFWRLAMEEAREEARRYRRYGEIRVVGPVEGEDRIPPPPGPHDGHTRIP